jgi:hypothetical protein
LLAIGGIMADTNTDPGTGFSALEEEFFRAGDAISAGSTEWSEPDAPPPRDSVWSRLFRRVSPSMAVVQAGHSTGR